MSLPRSRTDSTGLTHKNPDELDYLFFARNSEAPAPPSDEWQAARPPLPSGTRRAMQATAAMVTVSVVLFPAIYIYHHMVMPEPAALSGTGPSLPGNAAFREGPGDAWSDQLLAAAPPAGLTGPHSMYHTPRPTPTVGHESATVTDAFVDVERGLAAGRTDTLPLSVAPQLEGTSLAVLAGPNPDAPQTEGTLAQGPAVGDSTQASAPAEDAPGQQEAIAQKASAEPLANPGEVGHEPQNDSHNDDSPNDATPSSPKAQAVIAALPHTAAPTTKSETTTETAQATTAAAHVSAATDSAAASPGTDKTAGAGSAAEPPTQEVEQEVEQVAAVRPVSSTAEAGQEPNALESTAATQSDKAQSPALLAAVGPLNAAWTQTQAGPVLSNAAQQTSAAASEDASPGSGNPGPAEAAPQAQPPVPSKAAIATATDTDSTDTRRHDAESSTPGPKAQGAAPATQTQLPPQTPAEKAQPQAETASAPPSPSSSTDGSSPTDDTAKEETAEGGAASASAAEDDKPTLERAYQQLNEGRFSAAVQTATELTKQNPKEAEAWLVLGAARDAQGDRPAALDAYRRCSLQAGPHAANCRLLIQD